MQARYSADDRQKELLNVLVTDRNAAIIFDSDKRSKHSRINDKKRELKQSLKSIKFYAGLPKERKSKIIFHILQ